MVSALERHLAAALHSRISRGLPNDLYPTSNLALVDFTSSEYLALSRSPELKQAFLEKLQSTPDILGSGGSRLLNHNILYEDLETRLQNFFNEGKGELEAIVFNSGLEANVGFFSWVPQRGDFIVYDLHIHASIHGGMRASKAQRFSFAHNSAQDLQKVLTRLKTDHPELVSGNASLFIALESIYSMDGSVVPLTQVVEMADSMFPSKNAYILVDEAHSTGLYGPQGRGLVSMLGLQDRVFARLHTFSKALSAAGAVLLVPPLVRRFLINSCRELHYTTAMTGASLVAVNCSFDALESGYTRERAHHVLGLSEHMISLVSARLQELGNIPPEVLSLPSHLRAPRAPHQLPTPIVPLVSTYTMSLEAHLKQSGMNARGIVWSVVPVGGERVRICLHADHTVQDVERLVDRAIEWAIETAGKIPKSSLPSKL